MRILNLSKLKKPLKKLYHKLEDRVIVGQRKGVHKNLLLRRSRKFKVVIKSEILSDICLNKNS
jgi:hypothetical protein